MQCDVIFPALQRNRDFIRRCGQHLRHVVATALRQQQVRVHAVPVTYRVGGGDFPVRKSEKHIVFEPKRSWMSAV